MPTESFPMVAYLGERGKEEGKREWLPESSSLGVVAGHKSVTIMPLSTRMLMNTGQLYRVIYTDLKRKENNPITLKNNQYSDQICIK